MGQQGPDHPGSFVGDGHCGDIGPFAALEVPHPPPLRIGFVFSALDHRTRAMNQERAHIAIASFRESPSACVAPTGTLSGHKTQPGGQVPTVLKHMRTADRSQQGCRRQRANPRHRGELPTHRMRSEHTIQPLIHPHNALL